MDFRRPFVAFSMMFASGKDSGFAMYKRSPRPSIGRGERLFDE
jgi:hypothetical protein